MIIRMKPLRKVKNYSILYNFLYYGAGNFINKVFYGNYYFSDYSIIELAEPMKYDAGLRIFELEKKIDEICFKESKNKGISCTISSNTESKLPLENIRKSDYEYDSVSKNVFDLIITSDDISKGYGISYLCNALEFLNNDNSKKSDKSCLFLDEAIEKLKSEDIDNEEKEMLEGGFNMLKQLSIRQKILRMVLAICGEEYQFYRERKTNIKDVIDSAYKVRNKVSHGSWDDNKEKELKFDLKELQLIVLKVLSYKMSDE